MSNESTELSTKKRTWVIGLVIVGVIALLGGLYSLGYQVGTNLWHAENAASATTSAPATTESTDEDGEPGAAIEPAAAEKPEATEQPAAAKEPAADEDAEPRFELTGELDLTTVEINDMVDFVEESAGREFVRPPKIVVQSIDEFEAGLVPSDEILQLQKDSAETSARFSQALGHMALGPDEFLETLMEVATSTDLISGRYDPYEDTVYVPADALTGDMFDAILVHELLHALDGQHVDLAALFDQITEDMSSTEVGDEDFSISAVVEGRATVVQTEWMMANNVVPEQQEVPELLKSVPATLVNELILPYQLGAQSISQLGGASETWDLYDAFPTSSEQMIFPARIGTDLPVDVAKPQAGDPVLLEGVVGAEGILLLGIGDNLEPSQLEVLTALEAADGWAGDGFVLTGTEESSCFVANFEADTEEDLAEIEALFTTWAERETTSASERTVTSNGEQVTIKTCAPFIS